VFAKCNNEVEKGIEQIHLNSPFKKGILLERAEKTD